MEWSAQDQWNAVKERHCRYDLPFIRIVRSLTNNLFALPVHFLLSSDDISKQGSTPSAMQLELFIAGIDPEELQDVAPKHQL